MLQNYFGNDFKVFPILYDDYVKGASTKIDELVQSTIKFCKTAGVTGTSGVNQKDEIAAGPSVEVPAAF